MVKELRAALLGENVSAQGVTKEIEAATSRSENPEAHRLSLQGWFFLNKRTPADIARASEFYEQALVIDPNDSRSHAGMAHVHLQLALYGTTTRDGVTTLAMLRKAGAAAEKALACDPALALPHLALSWIALIGDYDAARAMKEAEIAHSLAPDDAEVLRYVGCRHMELGRFEQAEALLARGIGLDPLSVALRVNYCMLAEFSMRLDDAKRRAQKVLEIDPSSWWIYHHLNRIARMEGRYADAVECRAKAAELRGDADAARFHRASFVNADWPQYLRALTRSPEYCYSRLELACAYAGLGEIGAAFAMLDQVLEAHEQFIGWIKVDPLLAPLHGDPRFPALLRRVGLDA